ncbi:hypothetical protein MUK42_33802 [Musa troglodytarum]|uniref:Uncharacterized protein n=1 Tax=Musa troglodytarum TaxID=320322 RepID=A0A9E7HLV5_9LILI|nr:hypothetical protein MUK42_33802 [Musa troglodytarum]
MGGGHKLDIISNLERNYNDSWQTVLLDQHLCPTEKISMIIYINFEFRLIKTRKQKLYLGATRRLSTLSSSVAIVDDSRRRIEPQFGLHQTLIELSPSP